MKSTTIKRIWEESYNKMFNDWLERNKQKFIKKHQAKSFMSDCCSGRADDERGICLVCQEPCNLIEE